jgi:hypothetical protein
VAAFALNSWKRLSALLAISNTTSLRGTHPA